MASWQPTADFLILRQRADLLANIRSFFKARKVLEVETPLLSKHTVTDRYIESFSVGASSQTYYLQTSPEYAMKRLLAAGSGPIFQISKAFRNDECGRQHNPEFTLLEWYRPGFTHHELMDEVEALLTKILKAKKAERVTYQSLFQKHCQLDPFSCELDTLKQAIKKHKYDHTRSRHLLATLIFSEN